MTPRILLVSENPDHTRHYTLTIRSFGAEVVLAPNLLGPSRRHLLAGPFHGVAIDIATAIRSNVQGRAFLREMEASYPVIKVRRDGLEVRGISSWCKGGLTEFVDYCRAMKPRQLRLQKRIGYQGRALVSRFEDGLCPSQSLTLNISKGGVFVFSSSAFHESEPLWLTLPFLGDNSLIPVEVCWVARWDSSARVPGFGAKFLSMADSQQKNLREILRSVPGFQG